MTQFHTPNQPNPSDMRNLIITVILCTALFYIWQVTYLRPQQAEWQQEQIEQEKELTKEIGNDGVLLPSASGSSVGESATSVSSHEVLPREDAIDLTPRVKISSASLHGSVNLQGLRLDDLTLVRHRMGDDETSPEVVLLSPSRTESRYFAQLGWLTAGGSSVVTLPDHESIWQADHSELTPAKPVTFTWVSPEGVTFAVTMAIDENYMFTITQNVQNDSAGTLKLMPYGLINRARPEGDKFSGIVHEGPIATINQELTEISYGDLADDERKQSFKSVSGWLGIADRYWLTAFVPSQEVKMDMNVQYMAPSGNERVQMDYLLPVNTVASGASVSNETHFFAGAKELDLLQAYQEANNIPLFDRALDFGVLYFLTYPIFVVLSMCYALVGNFGVAIMLLVVLLKILLFPIANKSYKSMAQMKSMTPELERIRKLYEHDKLRMQQETMALWKKEKVNPVSGCLPILIQLPIFFALYKVLLVTIEMRHAPFFGWITDLSAPDPTNIFTLFGLIPWDTPSLLHLGAWPIIMTATMVLQQKLNPKPTDPAQAKVIAIMPYLFLFLFASFPAGLVIYWAWNNVLSMIQQWVITRRFEASKTSKKTEFIAQE